MTSTVRTPPVRLALLPPAGGPRRIDGVWWPRTRDLAAELPALLTVLAARWGRVTHVTADSDMWLAGPPHLLHDNSTVRVNRSGREGHRRTICLVSPASAAAT
ncbi:DUF5994 family protein [Streptomyces stramineus]